MLWEGKLMYVNSNVTAVHAMTKKFVAIKELTPVCIIRDLYCDDMGHFMTTILVPSDQLPLIAEIASVHLCKSPENC